MSVRVRECRHRVRERVSLTFRPGRLAPLGKERTAKDTTPSLLVATSTIGIACVRPWKILCDFDGTICAPDATDAILERLAAPQWRDIERDWRAGLIGSRECMSRQIALVDASKCRIEAGIVTIN